MQTMHRSGKETNNSEALALGQVKRSRQSRHEHCLFNDVIVIHLTSADLQLKVVTRVVESAKLADLTDAPRTFRQCLFTNHNCTKSKPQLQLRGSANLSGSITICDHPQGNLASIADAWPFNKIMNILWLQSHGLTNFRIMLSA